mmetsp:Transcript_31288/g.53433  ORF Transcript_31288/g.53433 Transcript_31288/m.53433 type:complete len:201 (+) Transcript_31288:178-780(+)|eukprot:CAMPEP_0183713696 /NCGR_PEP_ID=MMETSP0737-20130205/8464_1 /TAXON_ID=385413 /ORGANISM="Thalassiosira miniscula, Strain CCMP1093" /LENGTH=200 /DNA_ID=CAMNT_0025942515 /DNA_START=168 /DNA_END=770 /DNA_ORIENTATION=-
MTILSQTIEKVSNCCGAGLGKIFHKDDEDDVPAAATAASSKPNGSKPNGSKPTAAAAPAKPASKKTHGFTDKEAKYEDVPWSKLPLSARKAAKAIGFDEKQWDDKEWLEIDDKHWEDLTDEEKTACETLGWDANSWDEKYEDQAWEDLPENVKKAAEKLGWNQENWDDDWDTPTWEKEWTDFTDEEKRCLHVLGYYVHTW